MSRRPSARRPGGAARALGAALTSDFGDAGVYMPDEECLRPRIIPTGVDPIDVAIGIGGAPEGRVIIYHGPQSCGKTTAAGHFVANVQRMGGVVVYIDGERKLDLPYMRQVGVELDSLVVVRPRFIEEAFALIEKVGSHVRKDKGDETAPILVVWDSIHSLPAKYTFENDFDKGSYSPEAAAYDRGFKKGIGIISDRRIIVLFISQVRMSPDGFIVKEKVGIGKAVGHAATVIVHFRAPKPIGKVGAGREGNLVDFVIQKNQIARPWVPGQFPVMFGSGVDIPAAVLNAATMVGLAKKDKGGWYFLETEEGPVRVLGAGGLRKMQAEDPGAFEAFRAHIRAQLGKVELLREEPGEAEPEALEVEEES